MSDIELKRKIIIAQREALSYNERRIARSSQAILIRNFLLARIGLKEYLSWSEANKEILKGTVPLNDESELRVYLGLLRCSPPEIASTVQHELAHYNTALSYNLCPRLGVCLTRAQEGYGYRYAAHVAINIPSDYQEDLAREAIRAILLAPGDDMSLSDRACLPRAS